MKVIVELYGIPRHRAGTASVELEWHDVTPSGAVPLSRVLEQLAVRCPALAETCLEQQGANWRVAPHVLAQVGDAFTRDSSAPVAEGERLLLLSADAGG